MKISNEIQVMEVHRLVMITGFVDPCFLKGVDPDHDFARTST
jgi:hypothetical protein